LRRARQVLGAVTHPTKREARPWPELPTTATRIELDLDSTIENSPVAVASAANQLTADIPLMPEDLILDYDVHRELPLVLCLDISLSMMGENLALMAVAMAVVLLELREDPIGIVGFDDDGRVLKAPSERLSACPLVERLLDVPGRPYTHIEAGLRKALDMGTRCSSSAKRPAVSTVLLTDGRYTLGNDPAYLAPSFSHLLVLNMGKATSGRDLCRELAKRGNGSVKEVPDLNVLPFVMYQVVQDLLRGRSL
jgi:Mg-chelatase subunit ChlD